MTSFLPAWRSTTPYTSGPKPGRKLGLASALNSVWQLIQEALTQTIKTSPPEAERFERLVPIPLASKLNMQGLELGKSNAIARSFWTQMNG